MNSKRDSRPTIVHRLSCALALLLSLSLASCAGGHEAGLLLAAETSSGGEEAASVADARTHRVLIATTRARDDRLGALFGGERSTTLDFAKASISVPPSHVKGQIEWPGQGTGDPRKNFVARATDYLDGEKAFVAALDRELSGRPPGQRRVIVFIHGYNTMFAEGLYRFVQIVDDAESPALPVHFSWASRGKVAGYVYDNNSATVARDGLERTLRLIGASKAERVDILAHSMGNWVTVEALRQIRISGDIPNAKKVGSIVLASPDIDIDVFKSQMRRIGRPARPFFVVLSRDDRALGLSRVLAGDKDRVGDYRNAEELTELGAVVIDLTDVKGADSANHAKFAEIADVGPRLRQVLERGVGGPKVAIGDEGVPGQAAALLSLPIKVIAAPIRVVADQ